ncbi:hypothetical protein DPMN_123131 [Dreissena polymorpha]|uniref:Uncharacterized protein n=1 Tax=Dreissena polymorpha TaxID=45954 RepID=A0A9D4GR10_DREPO|nr:hypothetical protein DPMN_144545 [Dreissena polymorpha]KAH3821367.1 hypothetical protein DPMN_123131 [Dreissena polymorpha]
MVNTCPGSLDLTMLATSKTLLARGCLFRYFEEEYIEQEPPCSFGTIPTPERNSSWGECLDFVDGRRLVEVLHKEEQRLFCVLFVRPLIQFGIPLKLKARK